MENIELIRIVSVITHDAITSDDPAYQKLVQAAMEEAGDSVPSYLATFTYLHRHLSALLISDRSDKT